MIAFKKYSMDTITEKIKKAVKNYLSRGGSMEKVIVGTVKLPKVISPDGKVIDLEEKYKGYKIVAESIGIVPALIYVDSKRAIAGDKELKFIHFLKKPAYLVVDPDDPTRIYLAFSSEVKLTKRGIIG